MNGESGCIDTAGDKSRQQRGRLRCRTLVVSQPQAMKIVAGSEAVSDVVRPKVTIDLGHSHIAQIPEGVVDIIKDEVERYFPIYIV